MARKVMAEHWPALKKDLKQHWHQLSEEDLEKTEGKENSLLALIEEKVGLEFDRASRKLDQMTSHYQLADIEDEPLRKKPLFGD